MYYNYTQLAIAVPPCTYTTSAPDVHTFLKYELQQKSFTILESFLSTVSQVEINGSFLYQMRI